MKEDFLELVKKRFSVREFSDKKVEKEKIDLIIEAGMIAPTACNKQPFSILVISSKEALDTLKKCSIHHFNEQVAFIISCDEEKCYQRDYDGEKSGFIDASIVATHMMLEAESVGISSCIIMHFIPKAIKEEFKVPKNLFRC